MSTVEIFLMSPPGPRWALRGRANFRSAAASAVDPVKALGEWLMLADAIEERGGRVVCLIPPDDTALTGLPYAAECGQIVERGGEGLFLLPSMAVEHRKGERELWMPLAEAMGLRTVSLPGTWEAQGDVAWFRGRTLLFFGGRTDRAGAEGAASYFDDPLLVEVRQPAFHGNMAALPLAAADRVLVCAEVLVGDSLARLRGAFGDEALAEVSEDEIRSYATNGLPMGRDLLAPHLLPPRVAGLIEGWGMRVVSLPLIELCEKAGGASRCLVSLARVDPARVSIPPAYDYRLRRAELAGRAGVAP